MRTFANKISQLFLHHYILFQLAELFIHGNSKYLFPKRAFKLPFCTFSSKLQTFPMVKSKTIGFLLDLTQQYTQVLFTKTPRQLLPEKELLSSHYVAYSEVAAHNPIMNALKIAGSTWQNDV